MEYGSDFSVELGNLTDTEDNIFQYLKDFHSLYFDSGRSATRYLLHSICHSCVALPAYLCESIVDCFRDADVCYYSVDPSLQINALEDIPWDKLDVFYLLHYYGTLQPQSVLDYIHKKKQQYGFVIIEDTTHSIFTKKITIGDYCISSLRKWFCIPDGGVLYSAHTLDNKEYCELNRACSERIEGMVLKSLYLKGKVSDKEAYRKILTSTEEQLDRQTEIFRISTISDCILHCQSVKEIIQKRKQNHAGMRKAVGDILPEIQVRSESDVPYIYVTKAKNRNALRSYLTNHGVYCPVHWPLPAGWTSPNAVKLSEELISIPIDQRYGESETVHAAGIIRGFYHE